jgi:hypothetical protein
MKYDDAEDARSYNGSYDVTQKFKSLLTYLYVWCITRLFNDAVSIRGYKTYIVDW